MLEPVKQMPRIVIVGGGVAALEILIGLHKTATGLAELTLVCPQRDFVYRPLSVQEPFEHNAPPHFDLDQICAEHGAERIVDRVVGVDVNRAVLKTGQTGELPYDAAVIAVGAQTHAALPDAITFTGSPDAAAQLRALLAELERGEVDNVAFVVPPGVVWALPAYELALKTSEHLAARGIENVKLSLVTAEQSPLRLFGRASSERVADLLAEHNIELLTSTHAAGRYGDALVFVPGGSMPADRIVAMPRLSGPSLSGLPHDGDGFLRTDGFGLVEDATDVFAAGDITSFPVKQGGIATQQADAIVGKLAVRVGADVVLRPFRPVLRGLLLSKDGPTYLRAEIAGGMGDDFEVSKDPLWWPSGKIVGRYLSPYLAGLGVEATGRSGRS